MGLRYIAAVAKMRVNRRVLDWALRDAGSSPQALASATGRSAEVVQAWLTGNDSPHRGDLQKIATLLGRPPQMFFLAEPPTQSPVAAHRRSPIGEAARGDAGTEEIKAVRAADKIQRLTRWVLQDEGVKVSGLPPVGVATAGEYAEELRSWLGWDVSTQVKSTSKARAFRELRDAFESIGIIVLLRDMGLPNARGFSLTDDAAPLIWVNSAYPLASVRSYTLLHEVAHIARGDTTLHHSANNQVERWCEVFAATFLLPEEHLRVYIAKYLKTDWIAPQDVDFVRRISNRYKVSWHSIAIRLKELGLADQSLVDTVVDGEKSDSGFSSEPRTTPLIRQNEFGTAFPKALLRAVAEERISSLDARRFLNVNGEQLEILGKNLGLGA